MGIYIYILYIYVWFLSLQIMIWCNLIQMTPSAYAQCVFISPNPNNSSSTFVYQKIFNDQNKKDISIDRVRLRKFDAHASAAGKTYGGEESKTLKDLKFGLSCTMMLEVREEDETFEEYNPNEMLVRISTWDIEKQTSNANSSKIGEKLKLSIFSKLFLFVRALAKLTKYEKLY